jgi:hypothetical protein
MNENSIKTLIKTNRWHRLMKKSNSRLLTNPMLKNCIIYRSAHLKIEKLR